MKKLLVFTGLIVRGVWKTLTIGVTVLSAFFFLLFITLFLVALLYRPEVRVPDGSALVLAPEGSLVEQPSPMDPMARFINNIAGLPVHEEVVLQDMIDAINHAADDDRIKLLMLSPGRLQGAGLNQIQAIGLALEQFKRSGKVVIADGDSFNQIQYYLASWADEIYLHPMGSIDLFGFGVYRLYLRDLLDRLAINFHIFRVGTFKSALEPFIRNNMSPAAKEANNYWLSHLWDRFCRDIADHRGLTARAINDSINNLADNMRAAGGNSGKLALNTGLIDGLKTHQEFKDYLISLVGRSKNGKSFKQIDMTDYLSAVGRSYTGNKTGGDRIGIIVAQGDIVYGEGRVGQIGSTPLCRQIRQAREDKHIKALVLRIDSGGGSAMAAELIRRQLVLTRQAGKPVIISMSSLAASGGYWLAADADRIIASPMTLTGSIGIFGALPTFENSLARIGVHSDGTGTTLMADAGNPTRALPDGLKQAIQLNVEEGYNRFLAIVSHGRDIPVQQLEKIAEGRVWDGATALELGLVDQLGTMKDAVSAAGSLAGVPDAQAVYIEPPASSLEKILRRMGNQAATFVPRHSGQPLTVPALLWQRAGTIDFLSREPDPRHLYTYCLLPRSVFAF